VSSMTATIGSRFKTRAEGLTTQDMESGDSMAAAAIDVCWVEYMAHYANIGGLMSRWLERRKACPLSLWPLRLADVYIRSRKRA